MKQHKWHKEIKAWADGAEIECKHKEFNGENWEDVKDPMWLDDVEYRIKPQEKYLYVYSVDGEIKLMQNKYGGLIPCKNPIRVLSIGKIKLEADDE